MPTTRSTRSSVLGKRPPSDIDSPSAYDGKSFQLPMTPDPTPNPKRAKLDVLNNKENIPPWSDEPVPVFPHVATRALRRMSTEVFAPISHHQALRRYASTSDLDGPANFDFGSIHLPNLPAPPPPVLPPLHARARALLRPTSNSPTTIAGRPSESDFINQFIHAFLIAETTSSDTHSILYISGSPGSGKTALVNSLLDSLKPELAHHDVSVIAVNCMAFNNVDALWERLAQDLEPNVSTGKRRGRKPKETPDQRVRRLLAARHSKCILMLDELDHIASSPQALSSLFALAQSNATNLRVIGIANTHTLTSSSTTTALAQAQSDVETLHFAPYSSQQLLEILNARLASLSSEDDDGVELMKTFLPSPALMLLTKKIATQTGDVRAVFEVLRGAIDLAVTAATAANPLEKPVPVVTPTFILTALKAYAPASTPARVATSSLPTPASTPVAPRKTSDSETATKVRELGLQARLALLAILVAARRLDAGLALSGSSPSVPSTPTRSPMKRAQSNSSVSSTSSKASTVSGSMDVTQLHAFYTTILTRAEHSVFSPVSRSEFGDLLGMLETVGLITLMSTTRSQPSTPSKRRALGRATSFNAVGMKAGAQDVRLVEGVRPDEAARGLGIGAVGDVEAADVREEEVRAIWERERARLARETKTGHVEEVFEGAEED